MEDEKLKACCRLGKTITIQEGIASGKIGSMRKEKVSNEEFLSWLNVTPKDYQKLFLKYFSKEGDRR